MIFRYALRSLVARPGTSAVTIVGIALCSASLATVLALVGGLRAALLGDGNSQLYVFSAKGSSETDSHLSVDALSRLGAAPGVSALSAEMLVYLPTRVGEEMENQRIRGIDPVAVGLEGIEIIEGAAPARGLRGVLVGAQVLRRHPEYHVGGTLRLGAGEWPVTGIFRAGGRSFESELWLDRTAMAERLHQAPGASFAVVRLDPAQRAEAALFASRLGTEQVTLSSQSDFGAKSFEQVTSYLGIANLLVIALALGALFAGASALDASYIARIGEFATLIVIGFTRRRVAAMLTAETLFVTMLGGALGLGVSLVLASRAVHIDALALTFRPHLTPQSIALASAVSVLIGTLASALAITQLFRMKLLESLR